MYLKLWNFINTKDIFKTEKESIAGLYVMLKTHSLAYYVLNHMSLENLEIKQVNIEDFLDIVDVFEIQY